MTPSRDELRRLHFVNALFGHLTGKDLYLAEQIKSAIAFTLSDLEAQMAEDPGLSERYDEEFNAAAATLIARLHSDLPGHGFFHWDASKSLHASTPLFAREEVMAGLRRLAPFRDATLLITNLRPAVIPPQVRQTARRLREYDDLLSFIRDLTAARTSSDTELTLLFL